MAWTAVVGRRGEGEEGGADIGVAKQTQHGARESGSSLPCFPFVSPFFS